MRLALLIALFAAPLMAQDVTDPETQPKEFGAVHWYRNLDTGIEQAKASGKPIFLQFQEEPG
ncbi:MAG: thioredoxin family protein [Planctomycetes bacterium]|nr:thioredoxin family protein [Planctomycetota bacterium]